MKECIAQLNAAINTLQSMRIRAVDMPTEGNALLNAIGAVQQVAERLSRMNEEQQKQEGTDKSA